MSSDRKIIYERDFKEPHRALVSMFYLRSSSDRSKLRYIGDMRRSDIRAEVYDWEEVLGIYCMKCGAYHELEYKPGEDVYECPCCGNVRKPINANGRASDMKLSQSMWEALPLKLSIAETETHINVSCILRNLKLNPMARKSYHRDFQITIAINTKTGQTYAMPAQWKNKKVFLDMDRLKTSSFAFAPDVFLLDKLVFKKDRQAMLAISSALSKKRPELQGEYHSLCAATRANFLGGLYRCFPDESGTLGYDTADMWMRLKRRYKKNPDTFHKYLVHGCKAVATKSVRKVLYEFPEQKWTLRTLYRVLGFTDPNILRSLLSDRKGSAALTASYLQYDVYYKSEQYPQLQRLMAALRAQGKSDKDLAAFLFGGEGSRYHYLTDAARMYDLYGLSDEELKRCRNLTELHDTLAGIDAARRQTALYTKYNVEVKYEQNINDLEETVGDAEFKLIRVPWDLNELSKRFHNCVHSYKADLLYKKSVIVEMLLNGKSSACIELTGDGKTCSQAFAACNQPLENDAFDRFEAWTKRHSIKMGKIIPRAAVIPEVPGGIGMILF